MLVNPDQQVVGVDEIPQSLGDELDQGGITAELVQWQDPRQLRKSSGIVVQNHAQIGFNVDFFNKPPYCRLPPLCAAILGRWSCRSWRSSWMPDSVNMELRNDPLGEARRVSIRRNHQYDECANQVAEVLRWGLPTTLASYLRFRGWICQETLCDQSSVIFDLRQCALKTFIDGVATARHGTGNRPDILCRRRR